MISNSKSTHNLSEVSKSITVSVETVVKKVRMW